MNCKQCGKQLSHNLGKDALERGLCRAHYQEAYNQELRATEDLLRRVVAAGSIEIELTDADIDLTLSNSPPIQLSDKFKDRAIAAMKAGQAKREQKGSRDENLR